MNRPLKLAIFEKGIPAYKVAIQAGLHPCRLSQIANEIVNPSSKERTILAQVLGKTESELFSQIR